MDTSSYQLYLLTLNLIQHASAHKNYGEDTAKFVANEMCQISITLESFNMNQRGLVLPSGKLFL